MKKEDFKMKIIIEKSKSELGQQVADKIIALIKGKPDAVLGLATGSSPLDAYAALIKAYHRGLVSFKNVTSFNLDEYLHCQEKDSYRFFMEQNLFYHVDIKRDNTHFPSPDHPEDYDKEIEKKPIDLQVLGIGADGHIGFNEPGTSFESLTHITDLKEQTIKDNARFFSSIDDVPTQAVTMGLKTIMQAKEIVLIATGANKNAAIKALLKGPSTDCPASILNNHKNVTLYLDEEASKGIDSFR
jgi:glucosamine-6-phosphate deaminase